MTAIVRSMSSSNPGRIGGHIGIIGGGAGDLGAEQHRLVSAVVGTVEFDDFVPAGDAPGQTNAGEGGFGPGIGETHHPGAGNAIANSVDGLFNEKVGQPEEHTAVLNIFGQRSGNIPIVVAKNQRPVTAAIIDVLPVVHIHQSAAVGCFGHR